VSSSYSGAAAAAFGPELPWGFFITTGLKIVL
jgi:hypothetical protein